MSILFFKWCSNLFSQLIEESLKIGSDHLWSRTLETCRKLLRRDYNDQSQNSSKIINKWQNFLRFRRTLYRQQQKKFYVFEELYIINKQVKILLNLTVFRKHSTVANLTELYRFRTVFGNENSWLLFVFRTCFLEMLPLKRVFRSLADFDQFSRKQ